VVNFRVSLLLQWSKFLVAIFFPPHPLHPTPSLVALWDTLVIIGEKAIARSLLSLSLPLIFPSPYTPSLPSLCYGQFSSVAAFVQKHFHFRLRLVSCRVSWGTLPAVLGGRPLVMKSDRQGRRSSLWTDLATAVIYCDTFIWGSGVRWNARGM